MTKLKTHFKTPKSLCTKWLWCKVDL